MLLPVLFYFLYQESRMGMRKSLLIVMAFYGSYSAVIVPQKLANLVNHGVFAIALNKWVNIEVGITSAAHSGDFVRPFRFISYIHSGGFRTAVGA